MKEAVVCIEGNSVPNKVDSVVFQLIFLQHLLPWAIYLDAVVCFKVSFFEILNSLKELLASSLFK